MIYFRKKYSKYHFAIHPFNSGKHIYAINLLVVSCIFVIHFFLYVIYQSITVKMYFCDSHSYCCEKGFHFRITCLPFIILKIQTKIIFCTNVRIGMAKLISFLQSNWMSVNFVCLFLNSPKMTFR